MHSTYGFSLGLFVFSKWSVGVVWHGQAGNRTRVKKKSLLNEWKAKNFMSSDSLTSCWWHESFSGDFFPCCMCIIICSSAAPFLGICWCQVWSNSTDGPPTKSRYSTYLSLHSTAKKSCKRPQKCCPENELTLSDRCRMMIVRQNGPACFYNFYVCDTFDSSLELIFISKSCIQIEQMALGMAI